MNRTAEILRTSLRYGLLALGLLTCCQLFAAAQTIAKPTAAPTSSTEVAPQELEILDQSSYKITVHSDLVLLDVVVRDAKGNPVTGLHREDFSIEENGIPQQVNNFEATAPPAKTGVATPHIDSTQELDRRAPEAPVTIVVLDELTTRFEDEYFARYSLQRYLNKQGEVLNQPTMLIARSLDRTMVLCDYTTSKKKVLEALNRHLAGNDWRNRDSNFTNEQVGAAFASLIEVARATEGHPGHKNLVWIGRGFAGLRWDTLQLDQSDAILDAVEKCMELLRQARITLYAIDPAGVSADAGRIDQNGVVTIDDPFNGAVNFDSIARATGGTSMHGRNDVDRLVGDAVASGESFYTLSYRPSLPGSDNPKEYRKIKVIAKGGALTASSREAYFPNVSASSTFADTTTTAKQTAAFDLAAACSGLMVFDGIPLTVSPRDPATGQIHLSFPATAAGLTLIEGKLRGDVTLITLSYDRAGKLLGKDGRVVSLHLAPLGPSQVENRKIQIATALSPHFRAARLRLVVRSNTTGKIGAENVFVSAQETLKDPASGLKAK